MASVEELFDAIAAGDATDVRQLLAADASLARANDGAIMATVFARYMRADEIVRLLVEAGPPLDIFQAAMIDRAADVGDLLADDPSLAKAYAADGFTALHHAAFYGAPNAARALLDGGADVNAVTKNFLANMPLHAAAAGGHRDVCALLLERGADANAPQHDGYRALHTAAMRDDRAMAELLLAHGARAGETNDAGQTAADAARAQGNFAIAAWLRTIERSGG